MKEEEFVDHVKTLHEQNLNGREDFLQAFEKGIRAAYEELQQVKSVDLADVVGSLATTETCKVIPDNDEMFPCDVTDCCGIGPIVREKYCPECGKKIERQ